MKTKSLRPFIGAHDYTASRRFYLQLGFEEIVTGPKMSYFRIAPDHGFYLQDYYAKDWVDNTMLFLEVDDPEAYRDSLIALDLPSQWPDTRMTPIRTETWGREFLLYDPSGILWHIGNFL